MKRYLAILAFFLLMSSVSSGQTCTFSASGSWNTRTCQETGLAPTAGATIIIASGVTVSSNSNNQVLHTGNVVVFGTLNINHNNVRLNGNITIESGGRLNLSGKLELGGGSGCGFTINIKTGGAVDVGGTGSDRLSVCGVDIMKGNGACNSCGGTNSGQCPFNGNPYCEPTGGFTGPTGYGETGYDATLPISILHFTSKIQSVNIQLDWTTSKEENFSYFVIEHSLNGVDFTELDEVAGAGYNTNTKQEYSFVHSSPFVGQNYYRLKAVDLDDSYEYFGPIAQIFKGGKQIHLYPNPVSDGYLNIQLNFNPSEDSRLTIQNMRGIEVLHAFNVEILNKVDASALSKGLYILRYSSRDFTETKKFIVK